MIKPAITKITKTGQKKIINISAVFVLAVAGLSGAAPLFTQTAFAATVTVCPAGPPTCDYSTIQAAINGVSGGDTINVEPGTYNENLTVNKPLTLNGVKAGIAATDPSRASAAAVSGASAIGESEIVGALTISSSNVTIDGFDVTNGTNNFDINLNGSYGDYTIKNDIIRDSGYGILLNGTDLSTASVITDNAIVDNNLGPQGHGISAQSVTKNLTISGNYFAGNYNGGGNSESVNFYGVPGGGSYHSNITIEGNTAYDSSFVFGSLNGLVMTGNDIEMADTYDSTAIFIAGDVHDATISSNTLKGTSRSFFIAPDFFGIPAASSDITLHTNQLLGATTGVDVDSVDGRYVGTLDATGNWWSDISGPQDLVSGDGSITDTNSGSGTAAKGAVAYFPWCTDASCAQNNNEIAPTLLTPPDNAYLMNAGTLDWTDVPGASGYSYESSLSGATNPDNSLSSPIYTNNSLPTSQIDASGTPDGTYYWQARAKFADGSYGPWAAPHKLTVDTVAPTTPSASPAAGTYTSTQSVSLTSSDSDSGLAGIYYTTDGSTPNNTSNGILYTGPIGVSSSQTIKAIAYDNAGNASPVLTAPYTINSSSSGGGSGSSGSSGSTSPASTSGQGGNAPVITTSNGGRGGGADQGFGTDSGQVLGITTDNSSKKGHVKSVSISKTTSEKSDKKAFLGLGWWWLLILAALLAIVYFAYRRFRQNDEA
jgi:hypothetical protein